MLISLSLSFEQEVSITTLRETCHYQRDGKLMY